MMGRMGLQLWDMINRKSLRMWLKVLEERRMIRVLSNSRKCRMISFKKRKRAKSNILRRKGKERRRRSRLRMRGMKKTYKKLKKKIISFSRIR
jgi:hypothetical protein